MAKHSLDSTESASNKKLARFTMLSVALAYTLITVLQNV
jgi:hypothetical protein